MTPIYTKQGDSGMTDLATGKRVPKNTPRLEICGTIDELVSFLGLVRTENLPSEIDSFIKGIQKNLMQIGSELVSFPTGASRLHDSIISDLETEIDRLEVLIPPLHSFILPSGTRSAAELHVARTICRRAERLLVGLQSEQQTPLSLAYLNRLSDYLFVLARAENHRVACPEDKF